MITNTSPLELSSMIARTLYETALAIIMETYGNIRSGILVLRNGINYFGTGVIRQSRYIV